MAKVTFKEHEFDIELENHEADEYYATTFHVEYEVMDVGPDFSADNDIDFNGWAEIKEYEYYHDGSIVADVADHVSHCLNMEIDEIMDLLNKALTAHADI